MKDLKNQGNEDRSDNFYLKGNFPPILISLSVMLVYFRTLWFGFAYFDDDSLILNNLAGLSSLKNILMAFGGELTRGSTAFYRPLLTSSFILNYQLSGMAAWGYHLVNVLLHLAACLLFYKLLLKLCAGPARALFFSLLFAVHPLNAPAVVWIPGRNDPLLAVLALPMLMCFIDFTAGGRYRDLVCSGLFFVLALLTKETALVLPVLCLGYYFLAADRPWSYRKLAINASLWATIFLWWYWARHNALGFNPEWQAGRFVSPAQFMAGAFSFLGKTLFTAKLSPVASPDISAFLYGSAALALMILVIWRKGLKNRILFLFGLLWSLLYLAPYIFRGSFVTLSLEHRYYLPLMGLLAAFSQLKEFNFEKSVTKTIPVLAVVLLAVFVRTYGYLDDFKDRETFWTAALKKTPQNSLIHYNYGLLCQSKGQYALAENEYQTALRITPDYAGVYNSLGRLYQLQGKYGSAEEQFRKALQYRPNMAEALDNLGVVYYQQKLPELARQQFEKAIRADPRLASAHNNLGSLYYLSGRLPEAEREFSQAVRLKPDWAEARANLGSAYLKGGLNSQAEQQYLMAIELDGGNRTAVSNLAAMYLGRGDFGRAKAVLLKAIGSVSGEPSFYEQISYAFFLGKEYTQAVSYYDQAVKAGLTPDPAVLNKLKPYRTK